MPTAVHPMNADPLDPKSVEGWTGVPTPIAADLFRGRTRVDPAIRPVRPVTGSWRLLEARSPPGASPIDYGPVHHAITVAGRAARNAGLTVPDAHLAEMVAAKVISEAVTLDLQHGLFDHGTAVHAIRAIAAHGRTPMVRLPGVDQAWIGYALDAGAGGVIAPMVESVEEAQALVAACHDPPKGRRSHGPTRAALRPGADLFAAAAETVVLTMIETREGLERAEALVAVEGLEGLFVGPGDLGLSLGLGPGQDRDEPRCGTL